jgi:hypothetical protein
MQSTSRGKAFLLAMIVGLLVLGGNARHVVQAAPVTWHVNIGADEEGDDDCLQFCSLREAVRVAAPGDIIELNPGLIEPVLDRENGVQVSADIVISKQLTIRGPASNFPIHTLYSSGSTTGSSRSPARAISPSRDSSSGTALWLRTAATS